MRIMLTMAVIVMLGMIIVLVMVIMKMCYLAEGAHRERHTGRGAY